MNTNTNTDYNHNGHSGSNLTIRHLEHRTGEDRRQVDRRVCDRRTLCGEEAQKSVQNRRASDRRGGDRRTVGGSRRSSDATPAPLGYKPRLEPRGPGGSRKVSEITTTLSVSTDALRVNYTATIDRLAREFHQEVVAHFRQNLPRVQLVRATVDCTHPLTDFSTAPSSETVEITLRAICLCRRRPGTV